MRGRDLDWPFHGVRVDPLEPVVPDAWEDRPWASRRQLQERVELFRGTGKTPPAEQRR